LHAAVAVAQPAAEKKLKEKDKAEARGLYDEGLRHYNVAEYADAITAFKGAYLLTADPRLLFDVAQSYRLSGDCEQALRFYKNFQRESPDADNRSEVDAAIAKCEAVPPAPVAAAPVERAVVVDRAAPAPSPAPPAAAPIAPVGVSQPAAEVNPGHGKRVVGVALAALGAAAAGTGLVLGLEGRAQLRDLNAIAGEWGPDEKRRETNARSMETAGEILTGVGATALVAGVVVFSMGNSERVPSARVALGRHGGQVVWSCGF
jgi:tetratricopeptide (TPR) repeat protein